MARHIQYLVSTYVAISFLQIYKETLISDVNFYERKQSEKSIQILKFLLFHRFGHSKVEFLFKKQ